MKLIARVSFVILIILTTTLNVHAQSDQIQISNIGFIDIGFNERPIVETQIVAHPDNPDHLIGTAIAASTPEPWEDDQHCVVATTLDGGETWHNKIFDFPGRCGDPWVALRRDGVALFAGLDNDNTLIYRSEDGGRTWEDHPFRIGDFHDHEVMLADNTNGENGYLYYFSTFASTNDPISDDRINTLYIAFSYDDGYSFPVTKRLKLMNTRKQAMDMVKTTDSEMIFLFSDFSRYTQRVPDKEYTYSSEFLTGQRDWTILSKNGGYSTPRLISEACGRGFSNLEIDTTAAGNNKLYHQCVAEDFGNVIVHHSYDKGETWSDPVKVHQHERNDEDQIYPNPTMAVNKDGVVGVMWYDSKGYDDPSTLEVYFSASVDGGKTFLPEIKLTESSFNPAEGDNGEGVVDRWPSGGDYSGLAARADGAFQPLWVQSKNGVLQLHTAEITVKK